MEVGMRKLLMLFCVAGMAVAQSNSDAVLGLLNDVSEIVTRSKLNADHLPSTVSVLQGDELQKMGVKDLHEALGLFAGLEANPNHIGWKQVTVRGVYTANSFGFDKMKLMIDGVSVNSALYGSTYYYNDFPIELIERIEVWRGPASAQYGSGAYAGAVNVVTRLKESDQSMWSLYGDSYSHRRGSMMLKHHTDLGWSIGTDFYYQHSDKSLDIYKGYHGSDQKGLSYEGLEDFGASLRITYDDFWIYGRIKRSFSDTWYGLDEYTQPHNDGRQFNWMSVIESGYALEVLKGELSFKVGYNRYELDTLGYARPLDSYRTTVSQAIRAELGKETYEAIGGFDLVSSQMTTPYYYGFKSAEESRYGEMMWHRHIGDHHITLGYERRLSHNLCNSFSENHSATVIRTSLLEGSGEDWNEIREFRNAFLGEGVKTELEAVSFADLISLGSNTDFSIMLRSDHYNEFGSVTSTNFGLVHRFSPSFNLKVARGTAFRVPSWVEYYTLSSRKGNRDLNPEKIETTELFITYSPEQGKRLRAGVYFSRLTDVIDLSIDDEDKNGNAPLSEYPTYWNYDKREVTGFEIEYDAEITYTQKLGMSASLAKTVAYGYQPFYTNEFEKDVAMPDISDVIIRLDHDVRWGEGIGVNSRIAYIGPKRQNANQHHIDGWVGVDETLRYRFNETFEGYFMIRNLLNDPQVLPSSWAFHPEGLPREGRHYALQLTAAF